ncbi:hypothetical protein [Moraxella ovis]|uniref:hypothetical protein n=1 Tax=Moraxella ovis TaxID=29433 RepID=UPI000DA0FE09|nr:hypothetical protein [Moraxella ovis]SPX83141.1 Uncharacterised protein [Moraxella ovis]STZ06524.1 Uncharacterised protein [Moraxella ovis]
MNHFRKLALTLSLTLLGANLSACAKPSTEHTSSTSQSMRERFYAFSELDLSEVGVAKQITLVDDTSPLIINDKAELWQVPHPDKPIKLAKGVSSSVSAVAKFDKVAFADKDGYFNLIQNGQRYHSSIRLSPHSAMLMLPLATIAVEAHDDGTASLVRLEVVGNRVQAVARFGSVMPDARPVQINFTGDNTNGHIAVLSHPDSRTYRHGALGDDIEARQVQFLERHSLTPLSKPLTVRGLVFEANTFEILPHSKGNHLVTTIAGGGHGASTVVIGNVDNQLQIIAQSTPLSNNRWQSPFVFGDNLYAIQMPHLVGRFVKYIQSGDQLNEEVLGEGYSNHAIGKFDTNLVAGRNNFALIPHKGYRQISILTAEGDIVSLSDNLPAPIIKILSNDNQAYLLLSNGTIWVLNAQTQ